MTMFQQENSIIIRRLNKSEFVQVYGKGITKVWKEIRKNKPKCYLCFKESDGFKFEVEHIIPVCFGGDEIGLNNLTCVCRQCHLKKTIYDREAIYLCKRLGIVSSSGYHWIWLIKDIKVIHELYLFLFNMAKMLDKIRELENLQYQQRERKLKEEGCF